MGLCTGGGDGYERSSMDAPRATVLVVSSGSAAAAEAGQALTDAGYRSAHATSVLEAVQLTMDTAFDAALIEHGIDGQLSLLHHLRGEERHVPVLTLLSRADPDAVAEALTQTFDDVITAPLSKRELLARLERCLGWARRLATLSAERDELRALSTTDGLTQVANHRAFQERLREEFRRAQRYDDPIALILMDVDHFKAVNDTHGHLVGDEVLRLVARAVRTAVRETDFIARYGGEEFGVLLPKTQLAGALTVAERMSQALRTVRAGPEGVIRVTASFGVSGFPGRGITSAETLLKSADDALYRSKREGRNKISLFQASLYLARNA